MGLLDALFDPNLYNGGGSGLLDFIKATQAQNEGFKPSSGFPASPVMGSGRTFDAATFDPATYAQNQAQPISIGNYQMPRMGDASQYAANPAVLPQNAQPTQGQLPPQQATMPQQAGPSTTPSFLGGDVPQGQGILDRLSDALGSFSRGGSFQGAVRGQYDDPRSVTYQNQRAQFASLRDSMIQNGETPQAASSKAMLAILNPEAAKTVVPESLTNKEKLVMVKDGFGGETPMWSNERDQTLRPATGSSASAGSSAPNSPQAVIDSISAKSASGAKREDLMQEVPSMYRPYVEAVLAGKALPANMGRAQVRAPIMAMAHAVDPTFDETTIPLRIKTASDYAPNGQSGRSIVALNTVQHHIGKLSDDIENLGDSGWTWVNAARNGIAMNTPLDPKQGRAVQAVQDDLKAVTDEMSTAYKAGRVSDHEIEAWNKLANTNLPVRQLRQGIADFVGLLNGKRDQLNETHQAIIGKEAPGINKDLNDAITRKVTGRNAETPASSGGISEGATATNPQTGQKITFKGGKWVPVQ